MKEELDSGGEEETKRERERENNEKQRGRVMLASSYLYTRFVN